ADRGPTPGPPRASPRAERAPSGISGSDGTMTGSVHGRPTASATDPRSHVRSHMARHNVVFGRDPAVRGGANHSAPRFGQTAQNAPAPDTQWSSGFAPTGAQHSDSLEAMYARPSATGHDTGRMTFRDAPTTTTVPSVAVIAFSTVV